MRLTVIIHPLVWDIIPSIERGFCYTEGMGQRLTGLHLTFLCLEVRWSRI